MEATETRPQDRIIRNIVKILNDRGLTRASLTDALDVSEGTVSKLLNGTTKLTYDSLSKIAKEFSMKEIDIITYPEQYVPATKPEDEPLEAVLQIKLKKDKKDQVLNLIFGEHNLEILEK